MEKLHEYQGITGRIHQWRDNIKESYGKNNSASFLEKVKNSIGDQLKGNASANADYSHIYRHKTRAELVRVSAAVMGIEFSYAAETAFVSPTLLKIGVEHQHMTLVWALSPLVGFFLCPILGSLSDRCKLNVGRRRPFIILLSVGVLLGLILVPNGENLGYWFGDIDQHEQAAATNTTYNITYNYLNIIPHKVTASKSENEGIQKTSHPWGIFFTVLGTVLLDFDADACQSPSRAYLLDVCIPEDHARGLSTFTIMAGLGGFFGYSMGGLNWDETEIGRRLGGHVKAVFTIITFIFITCVSFSISSFTEIPLWVLSNPKSKMSSSEKSHLDDCSSTNYGAMNNDDDINHENIEKIPSEPTFTKNENIGETSFTENQNPMMSTIECPSDSNEEVQSLLHYLLSIVYMPYSLRIVCLTNLFCWMSHVCYSLYFTDFVGEAVFNGDPRAIEGTIPQRKYEEGVRFGCWGMAMYSLSCACYSMVIDKLIQRFRAKSVYIGGLLFYCLGMTLMALTRTKLSVILFSWTAGVMYSTLFTMPYLLVAHYHSLKTFELDESGCAKMGSEVRGLGTDVAIISSMVFLAQFLLSICMGTIVKLAGTTTAVITTASFLSFCAALTASKIIYLDL
ncbi:proton-associated sugar transporter A isoform X1 [Drosophila nasuta]|uniref:proton-associated sugar transporter A isoform X1 n=1 Tax=Drosophila nasuta TaxID=42062 RepID=UPI00295EF877|nr:proton-associated sugar transporter A isoform X1 [Drosophila nasuta]